MSDQFTVAQVTQLHEIERARTKRGESGLKQDVQELIRRLNDHGVILVDGNRKAAREAQAKRYWDACAAGWPAYKNFKAYLEDIPTAPDLSLTNVSMLHPWLLLIEPRIGFDTLCCAAKVDCRVDWVKRRKGDAPKDDKPFWVAFNDGRRHRGGTITRRLETSGSFNDHPFTAFIGVSAVLQKRELVGEGIGDVHDPYYMYLAGMRNDNADGVWYANLQTAPGGELQIWESPPDQACAAYGHPSYVRY